MLYSALVPLFGMADFYSIVRCCLKKKAEKGQIIETSEIKATYEKAIGHKCGSGQIYYVLHRHGWSKKIPRSKHPQKASEEAIEASKKLKQK